MWSVLGKVKKSCKIVKALRARSARYARSAPRPACGRPWRALRWEKFKQYLPPLVWTQVRFFSQCTKSVMLLVHTVLVLEHYSKDFFHALWQETEIEIKHFKANNDKIMNELVPGIEPWPPAWKVSMLTITPQRSYINICLICRTISGKCKIDMIHWKKCYTTLL